MTICICICIYIAFCICICILHVLLHLHFFPFTLHCILHAFTHISLHFILLAFTFTPAHQPTNQPTNQNQPVVYGQPQPVMQVQYGHQPQTVVVQAAAPQINPACPIIVFVVGFFCFPVWWAACCTICNPAYGPTGKVFNIISTVLGILFAIWIPAVIISTTTAAVIGYGGGGGWYYYYYYYSYSLSSWYSYYYW